MIHSLDDVRLAVIGLGYVGLPLAVEFGKGSDVVGFDINESRIDELKAGADMTREVTPEMLAEAGGLRFSADPDALKRRAMSTSSPCRPRSTTTSVPISGRSKGPAARSAPICAKATW